MTDTTTIKNMEQERAKFAYIKAQKASNQNYAEKYKSYANQLPMMIKSHGLGASLAFALSKSRDKENRLTAWGYLYQDIYEWLKKIHKKILFLNATRDLSEKDLSELIINLDSQPYRALTIEVLAFLNWLRRFTEGLIEDEANNTPPQ